MKNDVITSVHDVLFKVLKTQSNLVVNFKVDEELLYNVMVDEINLIKSNFDQTTSAGKICGEIAADIIKHITDYKS